jgi:transcription elongation factor Elf1
MSKGDGRNPKFRILCKQCNSYQHTALVKEVDTKALHIVCTKCGNSAESFKEEQ